MQSPGNSYILTSRTAGALALIGAVAFASPAFALDKEQRSALKTARTQRDAGAWEDCVATLLIAPEFAEGKLLMAQCYEVGRLLVEAKRDAQAALVLAKDDKKKKKLTAEIEKYLDEVEGQLPKISLVGTEKVGIRKPLVTVDGSEVAADAIAEPIPHNPGEATITITGDRGNYKFRFETSVTCVEGETVVVDMTTQNLKSPFELCMEDAKTPREEQACRGDDPEDTDVDYKAGLEIATYNDDDALDAVSPSLSLAATHPTEGWNVGAHVMVDVISAASADIVATASRRFDDVRFASSLGGGYKIGPVTAGLNGALSVESDYIGRSVGLSARTDLLDKALSPQLAYTFGFDTLGRADTDFDVFHRKLQSHAINAGASLVVDGSTLVVAHATLQFELGDRSQPYRHVPMFSAEVVPSLPKGASPKLVAYARADVMPLEQLPQDRFRYALLLRGAHRLDESTTVRGDERLYIDSWGQFGSTTDARYFLDLDEKLRVDGHLRFHVQGPVDFWQFAYVVEEVPGRGVVLPELRTGNRELGPLLTATLGGGARYQITEMFSLQLQLAGIYTRFFDHLYIRDRIGVFTSTTAEVQVF